MASTRLGLRASRDMFSSTAMATARGTAIRRSPLALASRSLTTATKVRGSGDMPLSPSQQRAQMQTPDRIEPSLIQFMVPGTMVPPPLSSYPRSPKTFFSFLYDVVKSWARGNLSVLIFSLTSKPTFLKARQWKPNNSQVLLTAKALHREMSTALASGNKEALAKLCVKTLAIPMNATIDARKNRRYSWELLKYKWGRNPRIVSQIMTPIAQMKGSPLLRQVVVRIRSRQRRVTHERAANGSWEVKEGGKQEMDLDEYVALVSILNPRTWTSSEWRILGMVQPTTQEEWRAEQETVEALERDQLKKFKM